MRVESACSEERPDFPLGVGAIFAKVTREVNQAFVGHGLLLENEELKTPSQPPPRVRRRGEYMGLAADRAERGNIPEALDSLGKN